jgi:hypothetical protein
MMGIGKGPAMGAASSHAWLFSRMEEFWSELKPATPYGKDSITQRIVHADPDTISAAYDDTDTYGRFVHSQSSGKIRTDRLAWHLGRIPRLPFFGVPEKGKTTGTRWSGNADGACFEIVELFLFKKFLSNYKGCFDLLDECTKKRFGFRYSSNALADLLGQGGNDPETFHISERYDEDLRRSRMETATIGAVIDEARSIMAGAVRETWGIDFGGRDFLTVPVETGMAIASEPDCGNNVRLSVEPYDDYSCIVRILPDASLLALERRRESLREEERTVEHSVISKISMYIEQSRDDFGDYVRAVERLDLARCRFLLKEKFNLCRPDLSGERMSIQGGRFLPLLHDCKAVGTNYVPIDVKLHFPVAVLFGSNMGGKTVALESMLFFQIVAQSGLHVPAETFSSRVFDFIEYVGEGTNRGERGLSSFGREICELSKVLEKSRHGSCFVAFDEFAHTTSSEEAEALLSAVIRRFSTLDQCTVLFATHFRGITRQEGVHWLQMAGLDTGAARTKFLAKVEDGAEDSLEKRIWSINRLMRYVIIEDSDMRGDRAGNSDALEVALLLGLESGIVEDAMSILGNFSGDIPQGIRR